MFKKLKIAHKLVVLFLVISVVPLLLFSTAMYFYTKAQLERKTLASLEAVTNSRAAHINRTIQFRQEQAKEFAGGALLRRLTEVGSNDPSIIQGIQEDIDSTFNDLKLNPTSNYQSIDQTTDIDIIGVWDVHGNIIANTRKELIGKKMPLEYLRHVHETGTYFGGFQEDPLTHENYLIHLEEIRNWKSGLIVGALSLQIRAEVLNQITSSLEGLGATGETYLVNDKYLMITPSRFNKDSIMNTRVLTEGAQACFKGHRAPATYKNYRDIQVLGVQKYLSDENWCLLGEIEASEAFAPVKAFRNRTLYMGGFLIIVIFVFASVGSRFFTRPILRLHEASQKVAGGDYTTQVEIESQDEIGGLAQAFNDMTKSLSNFTSQLEEKSKTLFKHLAISTRQRKELKAVNEELDGFVYTASHDLRAPLRAISSFASFLEEDYKNKLDAQGQDYLLEVRKAANKMNTLIEDLLMLSRISRIKNPYEDVNISKLLDSVLERLKFDIKQNNVELKMQSNLPVVYCDRIKMEEVFLNLMNNAIKFSSKKPVGDHPIVEVSFKEDAEQFVFCVRDNGIGIDPKFHQQIFGMFKRLHADKEYEGTGAGLSIIKKVIDGHQGKIWIESALGSGAAFYFTIPKNLKDQIVLSEDETESQNNSSG